MSTNELNLLPSTRFGFYFNTVSWRQSLSASLIIFVSCFGTETITAFLSGLALPIEGGPRNPYFGRYIVWPTFSAVIMPLFVLFLTRAYQYAGTMIPQLIAEKVLTIKSENAFRDFLTSLYSKDYTKYKIVLISSFLTAGLLLYFSILPSFQKLGAWAYRDGITPLAYVKAFTGWVQSFIILYGLSDVISVSRRLNLLFRNSGDNPAYRISLSYLHRDNVRGLGTLANYALSIYLMALTLFFFVSTSIVEKFLADPHASTFDIAKTFPFLPVLIISFLISLPFLFFLPLLGAHNKMVENRNRILQRIGDEYNELQVTLEENPSIGTDDITIGWINRLEALQKYFNTIQTLPLWPFEFKTFRYLFSTIFLPIVLPIIVKRLS